jgi:hypothetical protein
VPSLVKFVCVCGRRMKARLADIGGEVECPDCGKLLTIPAHDTDEPPAEAPPPPEPEEETIAAAPPEPAPTLARATFNPWADRSLEQRTAPWKDEATRKRNADGREPRGERVSTSSWLGVLEVLLVVMVLVGGVWFWSPAPAAKSDKGTLVDPDAKARAAYARHDAFDLVPLDATGVVVLQGPALPKPDESLKRAKLEGVTDKIVQFALPGAPQGSEWWSDARVSSPLVTVYVTREPISAETFLNERYPKGGYRFDKHNHLIYYYQVPPGKKKAGPSLLPAYWRVNDHLIVTAQPEVLKALMARTPERHPLHPLRNLVELAGNDPKVMALDHREFQVVPSQVPAKKLPQLPPEFAGFATALVTYHPDTDAYKFHLSFASKQAADKAVATATQRKQAMAAKLDKQLEKIQAAPRRTAAARAVGLLAWWQPDSPANFLELMPMAILALEPVPEAKVPESLALELDLMQEWKVSRVGNELHEYRPMLGQRELNSRLDSFERLATSSVSKQRK